MTQTTLMSLDILLRLHRERLAIFEDLVIIKKLISQLKCKTEVDVETLLLYHQFGVQIANPDGTVLFTSSNTSTFLMKEYKVILLSNNNDIVLAMLKLYKA